MKQYYFFVLLFSCFEKYQVEKSYNYYKRQYRNYLLLVKRKNKYITYKVDSRIVSFLFQIDSVEELVFDQVLFMELLELKESFHYNIAVIGYKKPREYYCSSFSDYLRLKNSSKRYRKERSGEEYGVS